MHRPLAAGGNPSLHSSQNPGRESEEIVAKPLNGIGVPTPGYTDAANRIGFLREDGPPNVA